MLQSCTGSSSCPAQGTNVAPTQPSPAPPAHPICLPHRPSPCACTAPRPPPACARGAWSLQCGCSALFEGRFGCCPCLCHEQCAAACGMQVSSWHASRCLSLLCAQPHPPALPRAGGCSSTLPRSSWRQRRPPFLTACCSCWRTVRAEGVLALFCYTLLPVPTAVPGPWLASTACIPPQSPAARYPCRQHAGRRRDGADPAGLHLPSRGPAGAAPAAGVCRPH